MPIRWGLPTLLLVACGADPGFVEPDAAPAPDASVDDAAPDAAPPDLTATRYPTDTIASPITAAVADRLRAIAAGDPARDPRVFMKVGASGTVSTRLLHCFDAPAYRVELDGRDQLLPALDWFRAGDVAGESPFVRDTLAAKVGVSAGWAVTGTPSPLAKEIAATNPRYAFVNYGTNDMGLSGSFDASLVTFYSNLSRVLDELEAGGIVPLVSGLNPRADLESYARWVPTFDAVTRGLAEQRQIPYLSLFHATRGLPGLGLLGDGIHGNAYVDDGETEPCVFTAAGLGFNYNVRNLASLEMLDGARRALDPAEPLAAAPLPALTGAGTHADPFVVDRLPFVHAADTRGGASTFDGYPACDDGQDESGPEVVYRLDLPAATPLRIVVLDRDADVDAHLLLGPAAEDCVDRHDRVVQGLVAAGETRIVVDTFEDHAGPYLLVVLRCEPDDPACD